MTVTETGTRAREPDERGYAMTDDGLRLYGQGMTVAALQALALRDNLQTGIAPRSQRVLRALARAIDAPWEPAIGADLAVPGVDGRRTPRRRIASACVTRLQDAAARDPALARAFVRVTGLVDRPEALLQPSIAVRVLRARMRATSAAARGSASREGRRLRRQSQRQPDGS